ncbi:maltose ABC transporter substrate-binding protein [Paenibacillus oenotherae]|uniref:Maltodextrin-binding protein n=1 Tax=Paenibacillus oenotherae TaxID=1435645 RepID=A0ABS7D2R4_9BACL|nr:maltose ABC transporter substrate-binding protein [Paenibacillus oenotherae]MBW7474148.1 maltose ABC transporter substrate-binding protein [Paenibacillus oenotherae]
MNKKNVLTLLVAMTMVFTMAACNSGNNDGKTSTENTSDAKTNNANTSTTPPAEEEEELLPEPDAKELTVWSAGTEKALVEEAGKAFKEKYGIDVKFEDVGPDKSFDKMVTDGPAGVGGDLFLGVHNQLGVGTKAGIVLPNDFHEEETKANNNPVTIDALTLDGLLYGYPLSVETIGLYYNKDLVPNGEAPKTWTDVISFAKQFNDVKAQKYAYMWKMGDFYWTWGFLSGYDAYVFGNNGTDLNDIGLNSDAAIEGFKFYQSLKEILPLATADVTDDIKTSLFTSGKLAMNVSGPWQAAEFKTNVKNVGLMEFPTLPNGKTMKPFSGVKAFFVNANSKYPNASKLFAQLITSEEFQLKNFELFGNLPSNTAAANNEKITSDEFSSTFLKIFDSSIPMPKAAEMTAMWSTSEATLATLWNEQADAKTVLDDWVVKIKDGIASMNK